MRRRRWRNLSNLNLQIPTFSYFQFQKGHVCRLGASSRANIKHHQTFLETRGQQRLKPFFKSSGPAVCPPLCVLKCIRARCFNNNEWLMCYTEALLNKNSCSHFFIPFFRFVKHLSIQSSAYKAVDDNSFLNTCPPLFKMINWEGIN